jgi:hypothetical protein
MATMNPLERKARNSFIKGLVIAGLIGIIGITVLIIQLLNMQGEERARIEAQKDVLVLNQPVVSGQTLTLAMFTTIKADANVTPTNALTSASFNTMSVDGNGNPIDVVAKIDIQSNTLITDNMIAASDELNTNDVRKQEFNVISLPANLETDETVDIRFRLPDGTDYIVVSKKKVTVLDDTGVPSLNTIYLNLTEEEILLMSNVIVEAYQIPGSRLYATRYVEPGLQEKAITNYVPNGDVQNLITQDPNVVQEAKQELANRMTQYGTNRANINDTLGAIDVDDRNSAVETGVQDENSRVQEERQTYLDALGG